MFTQSLPNKLLASSKSLKNLHNPQDNKIFDFSDLQFQLCSNFLKQTKQKLYHQQAELITSCEALVSKVQQKNIYSLKDISSTQDTTTFSFQSGDQEDVFSQSCKSMLILRKSKSSTNLRRTQNNFTTILKQIQGKCSQRNYQAIVNLIQENKKLKQRVCNIQKKQKQIKKRQIDYQKQQEQIVMLRQKLSENDKIITDLNMEIINLKNKFKQSGEVKNNKSSQQIAVPMLIEVEASLKLFFHQKQFNINQASKKLKELYHQVQSKIQQPFINLNSCEKCCQMLRKVKGSILKYRELMEAEAEAVENMYQKFKTKLK